MRTLIITCDICGAEINPLVLSPQAQENGQGFIYQALVRAPDAAERTLSIEYRLSGRTALDFHPECLAHALNTWSARAQIYPGRVPADPTGLRITWPALAVPPEPAADTRTP